MSDLSITDLKNNFKKLDIQLEVQIGIEETSNIIADYQRNQMMHGLRSTGKKIGKYKSKYYAKKKFAQSQLAGYEYKDLFLEGDFQSDIIVDAQEDGIVISSADLKTSDIVEREGEDIFGLMRENIDEYSNEYLADVVTNNIIKRIHG